MVLEDMLFEKFPDGHHHSGHPGYLNDNVLAILNLHVVPMSPTRFQYNGSYQVSVQWLGRYHLKNFNGHLR